MCKESEDIKRAENLPGADSGATEEKKSAEGACETESLIAENKKQKEEIESLSNQLARARADFYNFRTRVERDRELNSKLAGEQAVSGLLPVYENLERIRDALRDKDEQLYTGVTMVSQQFMEALASLGLEVIDTDGEFDPNVHEAVAVEQVDDEEKDGLIAESLRNGYKLAGRVLRAAQVKVSKYNK
jgi:molecular chaperone GrpE